MLISDPYGTFWSRLMNSRRNYPNYIRNKNQFILLKKTNFSVEPRRQQYIQYVTFRTRYTTVHHQTTIYLIFFKNKITNSYHHRVSELLINDNVALNSSQEAGVSKTRFNLLISLLFF